ncbi:MAG TPA: nuclear transport factor 2 family protein [Pyrinomonadaceae bacterium]|nr:nuclear transport factor 2 family protein [Pyrinomonadaceae bacterium]
MNKSVVSAALALCGLVMVLGLNACQQATAPTNLADRGAAASPTPEKIDAAAIEAEIIKLERDWANSPMNRDGDAVRRVLADDVVLTYPDGTTGTKADEVRLIESGAITMDSWELAEPKVTVLNADAAFITGRGIIKNGKYKDPNAKRPVDISGEYRFLDVYARRNGQWQAVASQATPIRKNQ